jgi:hypothetical protein
MHYFSQTDFQRFLAEGFAPHAVDRCGVHGSEISVFYEDDPAIAGMLVETLFDGFLGLTGIDSEKDQSFVGEFLWKSSEAATFVASNKEVRAISQSAQPD